MIFVRMAWRNVWRNFRRSVLTILAIAFGLTVLIWLVGLADGIHEQMIRNATRTVIGHLQIHKKGYHEDPDIQRALAEPEPIARMLETFPHVESYAERVKGQGLLSSAENSAGVMIMGIQPAHESRVTNIAQKTVVGEYDLPPGGMKILIGSKLAKFLKVGLGDKLVLLGQAADGSLANDLFRVSGIFTTGMPDLDRGVCYVNSEDCQKFFVIGGKVFELAVIVDNTDNIHAVAAGLKQRLDLSEVEVMTWDEVAPDLAEFIRIDDASVYILIIIVFFVVAIGILNTMLMSIFERVREFGIMMAVGTKPRQIVWLVMLESLWIAVVSLVCGIVAGALVTQYCTTHGIDLTRFMGEMSMVGTTLDPILYAKLTARNIIRSSVIVLFVSLGVAVYPAVKAARLQPVEAIRYV
jgi:ABC-type lipoprotein release transport system permease subunit